MRDFGDLEGLLGRTGIPTNECRVPPFVLLRHDRLFWPESLNLPDGPVVAEHIAGDPKGMLDAFLKIESSEDVEVFANRYGVMGICKHDVPASHRTGDYLGGVTPCLPRRRREIRGTMYWEPTSRWLDFVKAAKATLRIASGLRKSKADVNADDWRDALNWIPGPGAGPIPETISEASPGLRSVVFLRLVMGGWLRIGGTSFDLGHGEDGFSLQIGGAPNAPTFGLLAGQLASAVARANDAFVCSGCAKFYLRENKRPKRGQRNFCPECRESRADAKFSARDRRS